MYPSDFGLERMALEEKHGPQGLFVDEDNGADDSASDSDDDDLDKLEKKEKLEEKRAIALRKYELTKLRYYFAVAECDSVTTASALYDQLDGMEFEHSSMTFDLRFVPDELRYF